MWYVRINNALHCSLRLVQQCSTLTGLVECGKSLFDVASFVLFCCAGRSDFPTPPESLLVQVWADTML